MDSRELIDRYRAAWTDGDFTAARNCHADDLDFKGSIDTFSNADDFIEALKRFMQIVRKVTPLQNCYDDDGGAQLYDCHTDSPAGVIRTAEFFRVSGDRITSIRLVFDATLLRASMTS